MRQMVRKAINTNIPKKPYSAVQSQPEWHRTWKLK